MFGFAKATLAGVKARRVVLVKPSALGDVVHSLPVLYALRQRFPDARLAWIVNQTYAPLLENLAVLDEIIEFDRNVLSGGLRGMWRFAAFLSRLRRCRFDLAIDLQGLLRTGLMVQATAAPVRVGLGSTREGASWFYTHILPVPSMNMHAVDRYWLVAEALGVGSTPKRFCLPIAETERQWTDRLLHPLSRPWIMASLGTRWETKRWPAAHFVGLLRRTMQHFGGTAIFVGGGDEQRWSQEAAAAVSPSLDLTGRTSLKQLAALLARADLMLGNDSGPLHLAAAYGRPTVAPFTCTSPERTGPYGQPLAAVATRVDCAASYLKRCRRMVCMDELTPDRLWPAVTATLETWQRTSA